MRDDAMQQMVRLEETYWWFVAKNAILQRLAGRYMLDGQGPARYLDVGCGGGAMLAFLAQHGQAQGVDVARAAIDACRNRALVAGYGALPHEMPFEPGTFDGIVASEVIEHVEDDAAAAATLVGLLKPGGTLLVTVPAFQWMWGPHDEAHHHYRRYTRRRLAALFEPAGARVIYSTYMNFGLFPLMVLQRAAARLSGGRAVSGSPAPLPGAINAAFRAAFAAEGRVMPAVSLPWGGTVLAVVRQASPG